MGNIAKIREFYRSRDEYGRYRYDTDARHTVFAWTFIATIDGLILTPARNLGVFHNPSYQSLAVETMAGPITPADVILAMVGVIALAIAWRDRQNQLKHLALQQRWLSLDFVGRELQEEYEVTVGSNKDAIKELKRLNSFLFGEGTYEVQHVTDALPGEGEYRDRICLIRTEKNSPDLDPLYQRFFSALWIAVRFYILSFWLLWMSTAMMQLQLGQIASMAEFSLVAALGGSALLAFGLPLLVSLIYVGFKLWGVYKEQQLQANLTAEEQAVMGVSADHQQLVHLDEQAAHQLMQVYALDKLYRKQSQGKSLKVIFSKIDSEIKSTDFQGSQHFQYLHASRNSKIAIAVIAALCVGFIYGSFMMWPAFEFLSVVGAIPTNFWGDAGIQGAWFAIGITASLFLGIKRGRASHAQDQHDQKLLEEKKQWVRRYEFLSEKVEQLKDLLEKPEKADEKIKFTEWLEQQDAMSDELNESTSSIYATRAKDTFVNFGSGLLIMRLLAFTVLSGFTLSVGSPLFPVTMLFALTYAGFKLYQQHADFEMQKERDLLSNIELKTTRLAQQYDYLHQLMPEARKEMSVEMKEIRSRQGSVERDNQEDGAPSGPSVLRPA